MKNVLKIFRRDLKRLLRNRAAVLVLGGVCLLPSLYAWFNIAANMDPYGNTQGIKVAVANCDEGADTAQMSLNTTLLELLLCRSLLIFLVLSSNCTLIRFLHHILYKQLCRNNTAE